MPRQHELRMIKSTTHTRLKETHWENRTDSASLCLWNGKAVYLYRKCYKRKETQSFRVRIDLKFLLLKLDKIKEKETQETETCSKNREVHRRRRLAHVDPHNRVWCPRISLAPAVSVPQITHPTFYLTFPPLPSLPSLLSFSQHPLSPPPAVTPDRSGRGPKGEINGPLSL